jgi:hypothetical protein
MKENGCGRGWVGLEINHKRTNRRNKPVQIGTGDNEVGRNILPNRELTAKLYFFYRLVGTFSNRKECLD